MTFGIFVISVGWEGRRLIKLEKHGVAVLWLVGDKLPVRTSLPITSRLVTSDTVLRTMYDRVAPAQNLLNIIRPVLF